jgi:heme oxygenase (biliverdin-IX-beta and delta-forming)
MSAAFTRRYAFNPRNFMTINQAGTASPETDADVLAALRIATGSRHAVLDQSMPLSTETPSLVDYRNHLLLLRAWLAPLEAWLAHFNDGPQDASVLDRIERASLIDADLGDPAMPIATQDVDAIEWPRVDRSRAYRWGVGYVIEGSQLGGAVLYRRLHERLAPHPLRYLGQDGIPAGPRWQQFIRAMRNDVTTEAQIADACAGAADAFDALLALVSREPAI